ncbi:MAG: N-acetylglucosamine-6-phosphate deacetylase, partial [Chloroflexota bacterium]|nr:N-acetylglucosamine-6-phosphate deacetylase [Chloroflexota bacterium]
MGLAIVGRLLGDSGFRPGKLTLDGGRVAAVDFGDRFGAADADLFLPDHLIGPGLIDLQVNGAAGRDFTSDPDGLHAAAGFLPSTGVTSFLPTVVSAPFDQLLLALGRLSTTGEAKPVEARALGIHLEGPFLHPDFRRAHPAEALRSPSVGDVERLWRASRSGLRLLTLAPELPGAAEMLQFLLARGIVPSAGHSSATFEQASAAFDAGVRFATHIFNGQPPLHHRSPGLAAAALLHPGVVAGLIADGEHVHPAMCALVQRCRGWRGIALTTDGVAALGQPPGQYRLGGQIIESDGLAARQAGTGDLAGGVVALNRMVGKMASFCDVDVADAWRMASTVPAALLGESGLGRLRPGARADVTVASPNMEVRLT